MLQKLYIVITHVIYGNNNTLGIRIWNLEQHFPSSNQIFFLEIFIWKIKEIRNFPLWIKYKFYKWYISIRGKKVCKKARARNLFKFSTLKPFPCSVSNYKINIQNWCEHLIKYFQWVSNYCIANLCLLGNSLQFQSLKVLFVGWGVLCLLQTIVRCLNKNLMKSVCALIFLFFIPLPFLHLSNI